MNGSTSVLYCTMGALAYYSRRRINSWPKSVLSRIQVFIKIPTDCDYLSEGQYFEDPFRSD